MQCTPNLLTTALLAHETINSCRFKNVCPEWQQRRLTRRKSFDDPSPTDSAAILQAAAAEGGLSSRGLGQGGLHNEPTQSNNTDNSNNNANNNTNNDKNTSPQGDDVASECKDYDDLFPNGDADDFMILDVVMNVVSDEVVLGFFHIDGRKCYVSFSVFMWRYTFFLVISHNIRTPPQPRSLFFFLSWRLLGLICLFVDGRVGNHDRKQHSVLVRLDAQRETPTETFAIGQTGA